MKKGQINLDSIIFIILISLVLIASLFIILGQITETSKDFTSDSLSEETILSDNSTRNILLETPSSIKSATTKNQTWIKFNGIDQYLNSDQFDITAFNDNFTITLWINNVEVGELGDFIGTESVITSNEGIVIRNSIEGLLLFAFNNGSNYNVNSTDVNMTLGEWFFISMVYDIDNGNVLGYVNSSLETNLTASGGFGSATGDKLRIAGTNELNRLFNGTIDEVRIYNSTLNDSDIQTIYSLGRIKNQDILDSDKNDRLLLYLSLNENQGSLAYDTSGSGYNFTLVGSPIYENDGIDISLSENSDYKIIETDKFSIINQDYSWSEINLTYFVNVGDSNIQSTLDSFESLPDIFGLVVFVVLIVFILGLVILLDRRGEA